MGTLKIVTADSKVFTEFNDIEHGSRQLFQLGASHVVPQVKML